ncbi:hypothetical protein PFISCL1PPCAC_970, partial [Pristionchus fissidentatus]
GSQLLLLNLPWISPRCPATSDPSTPRCIPLSRSVSAASAPSSWPGSSCTRSPPTSTLVLWSRRWQLPLLPPLSSVSDPSSSFSGWASTSEVAQASRRNPAPFLYAASYCSQSMKPPPLLFDASGMLM